MELTRSRDRKNLAKIMNYNGESPKLELKLNLSPPRDNWQVVSPRGMVSSTDISPRSSCLSQETSTDGSLRSTSRPEASSMVLVGCRRCLMYVMLSEDDPKCPKCKSTVLLDLLLEDGNRRINK